MGGIVLAVILPVAHYRGGYVAGQMARLVGFKQEVAALGECGTTVGSTRSASTANPLPYRVIPTLNGVSHAASNPEYLHS